MSGNDSRLLVAILVTLIETVLSQCPTLEIMNTLHRTKDGIYRETEIECYDRKVFRNAHTGNFLLHEEGYWVIDDDPRCFPEMIRVGHARVFSQAYLAENIRGQWEDQTYGYWVIVPGTEVFCSDAPVAKGSPLSTGAIIAIVGSCIFCLLVLVPLLVRGVKAIKRKRRERQSGGSDVSNSVSDFRPPLRLPPSSISLPSIYDNPGLDVHQETPVYEDILPPSGQSVYDSILSPPSYSEAIASRAQEYKYDDAPPPYFSAISDCGSGTINDPPGGSTNNQNTTPTRTHPKNTTTIDETLGESTS